MVAQPKKPEMSKRMVFAVLVLYGMSMAAAYTLSVCFPHVGQIALSIFQTTATLTGSVLIGYYGKAGFENYDKNKKLLRFEKPANNENEEESEG